MPAGQLGAARAYWRDWQAALYGKLVQVGTAKAMHFQELLLAPEGGPYSFVSLEAYAKGDGPL